ncbi:Kinetochore-associated protein 1 [Terramyces sp. JEL0728]|nr:Kinetochore-associated protein 1 [Terramyces sp. JEL0728]
MAGENSALELIEKELILKEIKELGRATDCIVVSNDIKSAITCNEELFIVDLGTQNTITIQLGTNNLISDCPIEYMAISSQLLVIADSLGSLSFIDFDGNVLHSILLNNSKTEKKFQGLLFNDDNELIVLFAGNMLKITRDPEARHEIFSSSSFKHEIIKWDIDFTVIQKHSPGKVVIANGECYINDALRLYNRTLEESVNFKQHILNIISLNGMIIVHLENQIYAIDAEREINLKACSENVFVLSKEGNLKLYEKVVTDPKEILLQLLQTNLERAEAYAAENNISNDEFYKARLLCSPFEEIIDILGEITDYEFVYSFCLSYKSEDTQQLQSIFLFAKNTFAGLNQPAIVNEFTQLIGRVNTFLEIQYQWRSKDRNQDGFCSSAQIFLKSKMILNLQLYLSLERYDLALIVCRRHRTELDFEKNLELLISYIHLEIPSRILTLILCEIEKEAKSKKVLYKWILERAETIAKQGSFKDSLFLLEWASDNLKDKESSTTPENYISSIFKASSSQKFKSSDIFSEITKRITQLQDIIELAGMHSFYTTFESFENSTVQITAMSMLDRAESPDEIVPQIQQHIKPYLTKNRVSLNLFLVEYAKDLIQESDDMELRVFPILSLIECQTYRSEILIDLMRRSPIPWSHALDKLIAEALKNENKLSTELSEQYRMMELKRMVKSYGVDKFNVSDKVTALKIISLILSNDTDRAIDDAIMVSDVYGVSRIDVFVQRLQYLVNNAMLDQLERLLKNCSESGQQKYIEPEELQYVLKHIDTWILFKLDGMIHVDLEIFIGFLRAGALVFNSPVYSKTIQLCIQLNRNITPKQLEDKEFTVVLLDEIIEEQKAEEGHCIKMGEILGFEQRTILSRIGRYLALNGEASHVLSICKELVKLDQEYCSEIISHLIGDLISNADKYPSKCVEISHSVLEMSKLTVKHCKPSQLEMHMAFFKRLEIAYEVIMQTDLGAYKQSVVKNKSKSEIDGLFEDRYQDIGLVASSSAILPNLLTFIKMRDLQEDTADSKGKGKSAENDVYSAALDVAQKCFSTRNYASCIRICQLLKQQFHAKGPFKELDHLITDSIVNSLQNLLATSNMDYDYTLGCMLFLPIGKSNELFKEMVFKAQTPQGDEYRRSLVPYLLFKSGDLTLGEDFADQFNIEFDFIYKNYIQLNFFIHSNDEDRHSRIVFAIEKYTNKSLLLDLLLNDYLPKVSPYDYPGLIFLCQQILYLDPSCTVTKKKKAILDILVRYNRASEPSEEENFPPNEIDIGLSNIEKVWKISNEVFHNMRTERLPFHQIMIDPIKVLSVEITESTISRLIPLTQVLELSTDKFYEALINQKIQKLQLELEQYQNLEEYELRLIGRDITFNDFKALVTKIADYELLVRTTVYIAGNFPRGEDRIAAYRLGLQFADKWVHSLQGDKETATLEMAQTGVSKIKNMLAIAETENSLQIYGLQIYDKLVTKPNSLIAQLLTHENNRPKLEVETFHTLAEEVAKRNNIDLEKLKLMLLQKWITTDLNPLQSDLELQERVIFLFNGKVEWGVSKLYAFSQLVISI